MKRTLCYLFNFIKNTCLNSCLVPPCKSSFLLLKVLAFFLGGGGGGGGGGGKICFYNIREYQLAKTAVYFSLLAFRRFLPGGTFLAGYGNISFSIFFMLIKLAFGR